MATLMCPNSVCISHQKRAVTIRILFGRSQSQSIWQQISIKTLDLEETVLSELDEVSVVTGCDKWLH